MELCTPSVQRIYIGGREVSFLLTQADAASPRGLIQGVRQTVNRSRYSTTDIWPPREFDEILAEIGRLIFNWNNLERSLTQTLQLLTGAYPRNQILTNHMSSSAICDSLRTVAKEFHTGYEQESLLHSVALYEILREYRNYYVHSLSHIYICPVPTVGFYNRTAKGKLHKHELRTDVEAIRESAFQCKEAHHYLARVHNHFYYPDNDDYRELPPLHPLPARFTKPKAHFFGPSA